MDPPNVTATCMGDLWCVMYVYGHPIQKIGHQLGMDAGYSARGQLNRANGFFPVSRSRLAF